MFGRRFVRRAVPGRRIACLVRDRFSQLAPADAPTFAAN
jgi:hypothetical protein